MSRLFSPLRLAGRDLPNRIVVSPMCQYSAVHGDANDWHLVHLGGLAMSGAGLLILEATAVEARAASRMAASGSTTTRTRRPCRGSSASAAGTAGRSSASSSPMPAARPRRGTPGKGGRSLGPGEDPWPTVSASAAPFGPGWHVPAEAGEAELDRLVEAFASAARRAARLGFDVIELHGAHGYLLHQFLSPISNLRTDAYGGTAEKRRRFPLRVFEAIRAQCPPEMAVGMRITGSDWMAGGIEPAEAAAFARELKARGCDFVVVSSGGASPEARVAVGPGYQVGFAAEIGREAGLPVCAVGLIVTPEQAEAIVASGQADLIALGRTILDEPHWPWEAARLLGAEIERPQQYARAAPSLWPGASLKRPAAGAAAAAG